MARRHRPPVDRPGERRGAMTGVAGSCSRRGPGRSRRRWLEGSVELPDGRLLVPITAAAASELREQRSARLDAGADRCLAAVEIGDDPPPARLVLADGVDGLRLRLEVLWDPEVGVAFGALPGIGGGSSADARPVGRAGARRVRRTPRGRGDAWRGRPPGGHASRARRGGGRRATVAGDACRADRRGRGGARRGAPAFPVGGRPLRARRPADVPRRRAGSREDGRGAGGAGGRRRIPGGRRLPGVVEAQLAAGGGRSGCLTGRSRSSRAGVPSHPRRSW